MRADRRRRLPVSRQTGCALHAFGKRLFGHMGATSVPTAGLIRTVSVTAGLIRNGWTYPKRPVHPQRPVVSVTAGRICFNLGGKRAAFMYLGGPSADAASPGADVAGCTVVLRSGRTTASGSTPVGHRESTARCRSAASGPRNVMQPGRAVGSATIRPHPAGNRYR